MVDQDAVNLVKEALASGRNQQEIVSLMKQAGYTDAAISEVMTGIKQPQQDDVAAKIAAKNNLPMGQDLPKLGPAALPMQQTAPATQEKKSRKKALIAAVIILILAVLSAGYYLYGLPF